MTESLCSGGFCIQTLKALNLPSRQLQRSLRSMEHQLCDTICRTGAEKVYMLVSKITSLSRTICVRPKLSLLAEMISITVMFGDDVGSMLYTNKNQFLLSRSDGHRGQLMPISSLHFRKLGGSMRSALPRALAACWYSEHDVMLKEAVLAIQQDLPGSKCHLSQGKKLKQSPRTGRGKEGRCNLPLYHRLEEQPLFYCRWHFTVKKIKSQFSLVDCP